MRHYRFYNDWSALTPELWVMEGLRILRQRLVTPRLVNRQYDNVFAGPGETAKVYKTSGFTVQRKQSDGQYVPSNIASVQKEVRLNQHLYNSILLQEVETKKAFATVADQYLANMIESIATGLENVVAGEKYNFLGQPAGQIGLVQGSVDAEVLRMRKYFQRAKVGQEGRNMMTSPDTEAMLLGEPRFVDADKIGPNTAEIALSLGLLGRMRGIQSYSCLADMDIEGTFDVITGAVNHTGGYPAGTTTIVIDGVTGALTDGSWCTIAGDMIPRRITTTNEVGGDTTSIVIASGLTHAVANDAVITVMDPGAINHPDGGVATYDFQYDGAIKFNGFTNPPVVGQGVTFGNTATTYSIMGVDTVNSTITLNRPLDAAITHAAAVCLLPPGHYNLACHPDAIALVNRPLPPVEGQKSFYAESEGVALRVTITYDPAYGKWRVTADTLCGVTTLDTALGVCFMT
jgi:hypothetical protein